jgi:hypothetical protein
MKFVSQGLFVKKFFKMVKIKNYTLATTVAHELWTSIFIFFFFVVKIIGFGKAYEPTGIGFLHRIRLEVEEERCEAVGEGFGGEELQQAGNYSIRSELDLLPSL